MTESTHIIHVGGIQINFPYPSAYIAQNQLMAKVITALSKKQNAILESPTGSGKSLAILCSVLAWHKTNYSNNQSNLPSKPSTENEFELKLHPKKPQPPKIIFTSRTHSQLQQLIAEYRRTNYFHHFQMSVLGSRKSLCINKQIQSLPDRNDQCKKALDNQDCKYYRGRYYAEQFKKSNKFTHGTVFDIEDLVTQGKKMSCCPFFGTRAILETANLIFCPYNYILDPIIRDQMKISIENAIVIIDEAHNIEDVCRNALTKSYTVEELQFSIDELEKLMSMGGIKSHANDVWESMSEIKELLNLIMLWMKDLNDTLTIHDYNQHRNVFPHPDKGTNKIRDIMKDKWEYDKKKSLEYMSHAQTVFAHFSEQKQQQNEPTGPLETENNGHIGQSHLNPMVGIIIEYFCLYLLPNALEFENDFNMALLPQPTWDNTLRKKVKKIHLHFWCLSPSVTFKPIAEKVHSVILTSGTLSPLDAMAFELKCKFEQRLVADHVIEKGQVLVSAIDRGVKGNQIKCVYSNLQKQPVQDDIGLSLISLFENIPEGIVVFFPSYHTMQTLVDRWIENGTYERMVNIKKLYQEPRGSDEEATKQFMDAIETFGRDCGNIKYITKYKRTDKYKKELQYKKQQQEAKKKKGTITKYLSKIKASTIKDYSFKANENKKNGNDEDIDLMTSDLKDTDLEFKSEKGAVFFGVCRGKISEGIDFSDGMSRSVILIGIPYPNQKDPQIHFKKKYNDQQGQKIKAKYYGQNNVQIPYILDGKHWYSLQAFRALNQALGRCIRHKYDYGAIIFLESRFYGTSNFSKMNINNLSKWVKPYVRNSMNVQQAVRDLIKPYFDYMKKNPPRRDVPGMVKWSPPFEMPKNLWSKPVVNNSNSNFNGNGNGNGSYSGKKNRFFTQSPANNNSNNKNLNKAQKNICASQSPANNFKGNGNDNKKKLNLARLNQFSFNRGNNNDNRGRTPPNQNNANGNGNGFSFNKNGDVQSVQSVQTPMGNIGNNNNRKRKYDEIQNENENIMNKRIKLEDGNNNNNVMNKEPNCIQCNGCSAMICRGKFKQIELNRGGGKMAAFVASKQPFPCDTSKDCIWSSALGLTFMYKFCDGCEKSVGFHVVAAMTQDKLQYVGQILFIKGAVNLLTIR